MDRSRRKDYYRRYSRLRRRQLRERKGNLSERIDSCLRSGGSEAEFHELVSELKLVLKAIITHNNTLYGGRRHRRETGNDGADGDQTMLSISMQSDVGAGGDESSDSPGGTESDSSTTTSEPDISVINSERNEDGIMDVDISLSFLDSTSEEERNEEEEFNARQHLQGSILQLPEKRKGTLPAPDLTGKEYLACFMALKIKSNWPLTDYYNAVSILEKAMPRRSGLPRSKYFAKKYLDEACNVQPIWVVYCNQCNGYSRTFTSHQKEGSCGKCESDLTHELLRGRCQFIRLPIRKQLELYLKEDKYFRDVATEYAKMDSTHMRGKMHADNIKNFDLDLTLVIDGGTLYRKQGRGVLPAALFINNIPVSLHLRFPILASLFVGKKKDMPPRKLFLASVGDAVKEIHDNPISWVDSDGIRHSSKAFLTTVITDAPEKCVLMQHVGHGSFFACQFCEEEGQKITKEAFPQVFEANPLQKTALHPSATTVGGGARYPKILNETNHHCRTALERIEMGLEAHNLTTATGKQGKVKGVINAPALMLIPGFDESNSHVCDLLHVVLHGVLQDIMGQMMKGVGSEHNFLKSRESTFEIFDRLHSTQSRCKETERKAFPLDRYSAWTAFDFLMFSQHQLALYCGDDNIYQSFNVYEILVHLSNVLYLAEFGRMTDEVLGELKREIELFCKKYMAVFKEEYATYKYHVLQHFPRFIENHGSAYLFNSWNTERLNLYLRQMANSTNQEAKQMAQNFILKFHNTVFNSMDTFSPTVVKMMDKFSVEHNIFTEKFRTVIRNTANSNHFDPTVERSIEDALNEEGMTGPRFDKSNWVKVDQMYRRNLLLEIEAHKHPENSSVKDCYVMVDSKFFGEIEAICAIKKEGLEKEDTFVIVVRKYQRLSEVELDFGGYALYPKNQIPFLPPDYAFPDYASFVLKRDTFIQKALVAKSSVKILLERVHIFSVLANEFMRS